VEKVLGNCWKEEEEEEGEARNWEEDDWKVGLFSSGLFFSASVRCAYVIHF
jgi:hypothetical protein